MSFIRLYLVPSVTGADQQVIDVDSTALVLSDGVFVPVQSANTVTLIGVPTSFNFTPFNTEQATVHLDNTPQSEMRVCWREPVGTDDYPNEEVVVAPDPADGLCVCGITCLGTDLSYVQVANVVQPALA